MSEIFLTTADVEKRLAELQEKYGLTSEQFCMNQESRARVCEEDEFEWEVYLEHQAALREQEDILHREYLRRLNAADAEPRNAASYFMGVAA